MRRESSALDTLEAAYSIRGSDADWVGSVLDAVHGHFKKRTLGAAGYIVDGKLDGPSGARVVHACHSLQTVGTAHRIRNGVHFLSLCQLQSPTEQEAIWFSAASAALASDRLKTLPDADPGDLRRSPIWQESWSEQVGDAFALAGHDGGLSMVGFVLGTPANTPFSVAERRVWTRIANHLGAAHRLRRAGRDRAVDAVLSLTGRVEHLAVEDGDRTTAALRTAYMTRSAARRSRSSPDEALQVWQGLHDGRWSLVDHIDTDGKAFVLAVRNEPARTVAMPVTDRQRAAISLASLGYGNKQIGYALGVTENAVAMLISRASRTMGVRSRADLVRAFKRRLAAPDS